MKSALLSFFCLAHIFAFGQAGLLDNSFNGTGYTLTTYFINPTAVALQTDGSIITAGALADVKLLRYTPTGILDATFGNSGLVNTPLGGREFTVANVIVQQDQKIVVGGVLQEQSGWTQRFAVIRYLPNGDLDTGFGTSGIAYGDEIIWDANDCGWSISDSFQVYEGGIVKQQPDGKLIQAGTYSDYCESPDDHYHYAVRYNSNGSKDTAYHYIPGMLQVFATGTITDLHAFGDTTILLVGHGPGLGADSLTNVPRFWRVPSSGVNTSFYEGAIFKLNNPQIESFEDPLMQPYKGSYLIGGTIDDGTTTQFAIAKLDTPYADFIFARVDSSFGNNGMVVPNAGLDAHLTGLEVQADGKIVVAGYADNGLNYHDFIVLRLLPSGSLDATFGNGGVVKTDFTSKSDYAYEMCLQPDGKIIVMGQVFDWSNPSNVVARYTNDAGVSIDETDPTPRVVIYPNPTNGSFTVRYPTYTGILEIRNALGEVQAQVRSENGKASFNTEVLPAGMYFITDDMGQFLAKLMKL